MTIERKFATAAVALMLAGCFGSDSPTPTPPPAPAPETDTLTGTAAIGAPLVDAVVTVRCGDSFQDSVITGIDGNYSIVVPRGQLPCMLRVVGGDPEITMYSVATTPGRTNITPLTTLATAQAMMTGTGETSFSAFFEQGNLDLAPLVAELDDAVTTLLAAMDAAGYQLPGDFQPFRGSFSAVPGDLHDDLLEAFGAALVGEGQTLAEFIAAWLGGGDFLTAPEGDGDGGGEGPTGQYARAGFQGLNVGPADGQGDGTGDSGWSQDWEADAGASSLNIIDPGAAPVDYALGDIVITGGDRALTRQDSIGSGIAAPGRCLATPLDSDAGFYLAYTVRLKDGFDGLVGGNVTAAGGTVSLTSTSNRSPFITLSLSGHPGVGAYTGSPLSINARLLSGQEHHLEDAEAMSRDTYLIVLRLYNDASDAGGFNRMAVWLNPDSASAAPEPLLVVADDHYSLPTELNCLDFGSGNARGLNYDEFRFAADWASLFGDGDGGGDGGGDGEAPTGPDMVGALAGTYEVAFVHEGLHARGTVVIGADNGIDFDSGVAFSGAETDGANVYDRLGCCNRIDVDYGENGYVRLYLGENGELRDIRFELDGAATTISFLELLPEGDSDGQLLVGNGIIGTIDSVLYTQEGQHAPTPFLTNVPNDAFTLNGVGVPLVWTIYRVPAEVGVHYCSPIINGTGIEFLGTPRGEAGGSVGRVGRCTITVTRVEYNQFGNATAVEGRFAVELLTRGDLDVTSGDDLAIVTDGYFRYDP